MYPIFVFVLAFVVYYIANNILQLVPSGVVLLMALTTGAAAGFSQFISRKRKRHEQELHQEVSKSLETLGNLLLNESRQALKPISLEREAHELLREYGELMVSWSKLQERFKSPRTKPALLLPRLGAAWTQTAEFVGNLEAFMAGRNLTDEPALVELRLQLDAAKARKLLGTEGLGGLSHER